MERWTRLRRRTAVVALVIGLTLSVGTVGLAGAASSSSAAGHSLRQESAADVTIEFTSCSAATISGDADRVSADTSFYGPSGVGGNTFGPDSVSGTTTIEVPGDGISGESLDSVTVYRDGEAAAEKTNPDRDSCWNDIRPEAVSTSFVSQERTGENTSEATFEYTNPNDAALLVGSDFDADVSGEAPEELESGTHQFTVEWSPGSDTETLTWTAHLGTFGYGDVQATSSEPSGTATANDASAGAAAADSGNVETTTQETMTSDDSTTDDETSGTPTIEFNGCSAATVSGDADSVTAHTSFYGPSGIGDNRLGFDSVSGTTTIEVPGDGINGESLDSVTVSRDGEVVAEKTNPNRDSCWEQIRPKGIGTSFVGAERTGDGRYEATFEYTNPNDDALFVGSDFSADVSGEAPEELEPGTHQFSVEWTPEDADAELAWTVHLETFGLGTVSASGSAPDETTANDSDDDNGSDGGADTVRTDGGSDDSAGSTATGGASDDGSDDSGTASSGSDDANGAGADGSASGGASDASDDSNGATTTEGAAEGSSGTDGANADSADGTPTATPTATATEAADETDGAMDDGTADVETEISGGVESSGQSGFGIAAALLAFVGSVLLGRRRR